MRCRMDKRPHKIEGVFRVFVTKRKETNKNTMSFEYTKELLLKCRGFMHAQKIISDLGYKNYYGLEYITPIVWNTIYKNRIDDVLDFQNDLIKEYR